MSKTSILDLLSGEANGELSPTEKALIQRATFDAEITDPNGDVTRICILASDSVDATLQAVGIFYSHREPRPMGLKVKVEARVRP